MDNTNNSENEIKLYKERLRIALKAAKICIFEVDLLRQLYTYFENAEVIFGVSGEDILKDVQPFSTLDPEEYQLRAGEYFSHPDDADVIQEAFASILSGKPITYEARMRAGTTSYVWCRINVTPIAEDGVPVKMIGVITDITDIKQTTDQLKQAANLDSFTGLYNKVYATDAISDILSKGGHKQHALVLLDIDNFKNINDTHGHEAGDRIIKALARHMRGCFRKTDILGRFGGDEFIILARNVPSDTWLRNKLSALKRFEADSFVGTTSVGVSLFPQDGATLGDLFRKADKALYQAKEMRESFMFYSELDKD